MQCDLLWTLILNLISLTIFCFIIPTFAFQVFREGKSPLIRKCYKPLERADLKNYVKIMIPFEKEN